MFDSSAKMSLEESDVQTDEDEELGEDGFSLPADVSEKKTSRKRSSGKTAAIPKSPYLSSLNVNPRRSATGAWRPPKASTLGDSRGDTPGETGSTRLSSLLSNGHDVALRSECEVTPELLKQTLSTKKYRHLHSASNGFTLGACDYREKEDMYDEIIRLKKSLQAQKSDNHQMKAKLRRLEEENAKREKQIEELLDPTKGSEYTRSLVDKKKEGSVVLNGLKQRILKLEQQCRDKENALSKLQSELRTTNLEELKITVETYFQEIQRLRILLEAAEKSSRAESKCSQRQQKALSSTVRRLSENLKQLEQENAVLREELNTDSPAGGIRGYREWSKQRLLRRLLEMEKRLEDSRRHAQLARSCGRLDQGVQAAPWEIRGFAMATEAVVSVGTITDKWEEEEVVSDLRKLLSQLEKEKEELNGRLLSRDDDLKQVRTEKEELEMENERWRADLKKQHDEDTRQHQLELEQLRTRIQTLEDVGDVASRSPRTSQSHEGSGSRAALEEGEERDGGGQEEEAGGEEERGAEAASKRENAALVIQSHWREHRNRDVVMLQSALRGHLLRESRLKDPLKFALNKTEDSSSAPGEIDAVALTVIQSAFRGHLARCRESEESSAASAPNPAGFKLPLDTLRKKRSTHKTGVASSGNDGDEACTQENLNMASSAHESPMAPAKGQPELHFTAECDEASVGESDDSDDIIVSPSRPLRSREVLIL